jgi:hypothetical protein
LSKYNFLLDKINKLNEKVVIKDKNGTIKINKLPKELKEKEK